MCPSGSRLHGQPQCSNRSSSRGASSTNASTASWSQSQSPPETVSYACSSRLSSDADGRRRPALGGDGVAAHRIDLGDDRDVEPRISFGHGDRGPQALRVRVREHEARDVLARLRLEVLHVDAAAGVRADLDHLEARHRHRRRVRAVRRVRGEHLRPAVLPAVLVVCAREQDARQLAVGARARLQRHVREPGDLGQRRLEVPHQGQRALRPGGGLHRMQARVAGQRRDPLVQLGVVLHRARAERVEARVQVEVALGDPVEVAHDLRLGDLGQPRRLRPAQALGQEVVALGHVQRGRDERAPPGPGLLEDRARPVALLRGLGQVDVAPVGRLGALHARIGVEPVLVHGHAFTAASCRSAATAAPSVRTSRSMSARSRCSVSATRSASPYSS